MSTYSNDITTGGTTTRSDDPEVIRRDIESTRSDLSRNVDALTEKVCAGERISVEDALLLAQSSIWRPTA